MIEQPPGCTLLPDETPEQNMLAQCECALEMAERDGCDVRMEVDPAVLKPILLKLGTIQSGLNDVLYRNQNNQDADADANAMSEVHELFHQWFSKEPPR